MSKPILFSGESIRAILDSRKSQTRRVMKPQPTALLEADSVRWYGQTERDGEVIGNMWRCPYGQPGDRLWVRETWGGVFDNDEYVLQWRDVDKQYRTQERCDGLFYRATDDDPDYTGCWVPSIFMPRWASRIALEVTAVRAERLQDINYIDIVAEGWPDDDGYVPDDDANIDWFQSLWDSLNAKRGYPWEGDPWVWVVEFERR